MKDEGHNSLFQTAWWLDATAPDAWQEVSVSAGDNLQARLPFVLQKKRGLSVLGMPQLTQTLGPWLHEPESKYATQLAREKELMTALIEQLPPHNYFLQNFHYSVKNVLPFYWAGCDIHTRYTYVIPELTDLEHVWSEFRSNIRSDIRKAEKQVSVRDDLGLEAFIDVNTLTFARQGLALPYAHSLVERIDEVCATQKARRIFFAQDASGHVHAAVYLVWDARSAYLLMSGSDPELRSSGATSLVIWEAIQFAATVSQRFDFEGSMLEPIERLYRAFGARQTPYFQVRRMDRKAKLLYSGRDFIKAALGRS